MPQQFSDILRFAHRGLNQGRPQMLFIVFATELDREIESSHLFDDHTQRLETVPAATEEKNGLQQEAGMWYHYKKYQIDRLGSNAARHGGDWLLLISFPRQSNHLPLLKQEQSIIAGVCVKSDAAFPHP